MTPSQLKSNDDSMLMTNCNYPAILQRYIAAGFSEESARHFALKAVRAGLTVAPLPDKKETVPHD